MTIIQHISCETNTMTIRFQCAKARMKFICAGYTQFLNMFKTFVLACRPYPHEKNTIRMDRNGLEWPGMITRTTRMVNSRSAVDSAQWGLGSTQNFWTCSKPSYRPAEATRMRRTLFELIVIVIAIARMTRNDHLNNLELSIRPHLAVDSAQ